MALETFKQIVERKGYLVNKEDRKIFEKEIRKSNFGMGYSDMIEFILYDSNDNQLPQGEDAKLVRYIHINDKNINEYFLITSSEETKKFNDSSEFIIDLEKLIKEAGYSNGIFRTEIRVVPLKNTVRPNKDLVKRYNLFVENGNFRDDTIYYVRNFIEGIDILNVVDSFIRSKGRIKDGRRYQRLIQKEFKVGSFDTLLNDIKDRYIESMNYFIEGSEWNITSNKYGKPKGELDKIELTVGFIKSVAEQALRNSIEYYLPKRRIQNSVELTRDEQVTFDKVKRILKTIKANQKFESTVPGEIGGVVRGCTDKEALNYNPRAKENDGSCRYKETEVEAAVVLGCTDELAFNFDPSAVVDDGSCVPVVLGCTDKSAVNFNKYANKDDGSCKYQEKVDDFADLGGGTAVETTDVEIDTEVIDNTPPIPDPEPEYKLITKLYYIWSDTGAIKYKDRNNELVETRGVEFDAHKITYRDSVAPKFVGDVREVPKIIKSPPRMVEYKIVNNSRKTRVRFPKPRFIRNEMDFFDERRARGRDYRKGRPLVDIDGPEEIFTGQSLSFTYKNKLEQTKTSSQIQPGDTLVLCAIEDSIVPVPGLSINAVGGCGGTYPRTLSAPPPPKRCLDPKAINYQSTGSCKYRPPDPIDPPPPPPPPKPRCNDPKATNYRALGSCVYPIPEPIVDEPIQPIAITSGGGSRGGGGGGGSRIVEDILNELNNIPDTFRMDGNFSGGSIANPFRGRNYL